MLTSSSLNPSALITLGGTISQPRAIGTIPILLSADRLQSATTSPRTYVDVSVTPTGNDPLALGACRLVDTSGRVVPLRFSRSGNELVGLASLQAGNYTLKVNGRGASVGSFVVQVSLAGDASGNRSVDQSDVDQIAAALGTRVQGRNNLDPDHNGRIDRRDLLIATRNIGAASKTITIQVANATGTGPQNTDPQFSDDQIYISLYGEIPANNSATNLGGWSYFDATGTSHSLYGATGALATVPYFTLNQAPNGVEIPRSSVVVSGEVYVGLGAPVTLQVNSVVSGFTVTDGGSGYTSAPTVTISGGSTASASVAEGTVTATEITNPGSNYTSVPTVTISGGGGTGATATATINGAGQVTGLTITHSGAGYTSAPTIAFSGGNGSGATAVAVITGRTGGVAVVNGGTGETSTPAVTLSGGGGVGATARAILTGQLSAINVTQGGRGYLVPPTVGIVGGGGHGATAVAQVVRGSVTGITITNPGSGYTSAPTIVLRGRSGKGAVATATIARGQVATVLITASGSGYTSAPTVTLTGGGGSGAEATAQITGGQVTGLVLTNPGSGYVSAPTVTLSGGSGSGAAATALLTSLAEVQVTSPGSGYTVPPTVYVGSGANATATATIASGKVTALNVGAAGGGYLTAPNVFITGGGGSGAKATAQIHVTGVSAPSPSNATDPNQHVYWDFAEFTMNSPQATDPYINADLSEVDVVTYPMTLQLTSSTAPSSPIVGVYPSRASLLQDYETYLTTQKQPLFDRLLTNTGAGNDGPYRILAPSDYVLLQPSDPLASYYEDTIGKVFKVGNTVNIQVPEPNKPTAATGTAVLNAHGGVASVTVTSPGANYTFPPAVTLLGGGGTGAAATAVLNASGQVTGVVITAAGSGYTSAPNVGFTANTGAFNGSVVDTITASGIATLNGTGVGAVNVLNGGTGYAAPPTVTFTGGGSGAVATAQINSGGQVTAVIITNPGTGYTSAPTVSFSAAAATATGTATMSSGVVTAIQVTSGGAGYVTAPTVTVTGGGGSGATATAQINGAGEVTGVVLSSGGSGYTSTPSVTFSPAAIAYQFTGQDGTQTGMQYYVYSPLTPPRWIPSTWSPTWMVFGNQGVFADNLNQYPNPNSAPSKILANIENQIVSAMSRGVALDPYSSWSDSSKFYRSDPVANWYAGFLHQKSITVGGLAYGFPYDDQGGNSTDVAVTNPTAMIIKIGWKQSLPTS